MKLKNPAIVFSCNQPFLPGQTLTGKASWVIERNIKVRSIQLLFHGKCKVKWTKGSGDDEKTYKAKEVYIEHYALLYGQQNGETLISAGNYTTPFTFTLPNNIPPTYQGKYGNVMYNVSICLKETGIFASTKNYTIPFVVSNAPTNVLQEPVTLNAETDKYGCCDTNQGNFKFCVNTDCSAYCHGQPVIINGYAISESPEDTTIKVKLSLVLNEVFYGVRTQSLKTKFKRNVVLVWEGSQPGASRMDFTNQRAFEIPNVPESDMQHCQFIDVCYTLEFSMDLPGVCSGDLRSGAPVTILSRMGGPPAPIMYPSAPPDLTISGVDRIGFPPSGPPAAPQSLPPAAPPSYFEATKETAFPSTMPIAQSNAPFPSTMPIAQSNASLPPTMPITQSSDLTNTALSGPSQTSYYDWNQSAFTYS